MKQIIKYMFLFLVGGITYFFIEEFFRGYSHWTMFILGGICFVLIGCLNEVYTWDTPLWKQLLLGASIITILEYFTGLIVNVYLGWGIWDYSNVPFNIQGQVCLPFFFLWMLISIIGIVLDDYLRYWLFNEERPRYKLI